MSSGVVEELREAIRVLHRRKDAAYRNAWKKRGEVVSILANIARKLDRIENVIDGAPATQDESILDTAIDMLVYSLKYQTFLADLDPSVADVMFPGGAKRPHSDGVEGFEYVLSRLDLSEIDGQKRPVNEAAALVHTRFADLESCFIGIKAEAPALHRSERLQHMIQSIVELISSVGGEDNSRLKSLASAGSGKD